MSRRALLTSTAGPPSPQHHPVTTTVGEVRLQQQQQPAGWHSPVPYLFGGLAAMLGLIAFALLILACSYWKLSSFPESFSDADSGGEKAGGKTGKAAEEGREMSNVVVIMAGKPTFIATPSSSRTSSFGDSVNGDKGTTATSAASSDDTDKLSSSEDDQVRRGSSDHDDALHHHHQLHPNPARGDLPV